MPTGIELSSTKEVFLEDGGCAAGAEDRGERIPDVNATLGQGSLIFMVANTLIGTSVLNLPYVAARVGTRLWVLILLTVTGVMLCTATAVVVAIRQLGCKKEV